MKYYFRAGFSDELDSLGEFCVEAPSLVSAWEIAAREQGNCGPLRSLLFVRYGEPKKALLSKQKTLKYLADSIPAGYLEEKNPHDTLVGVRLDVVQSALVYLEG